MEYQEFLCVVEKKMNQRLKGGITASIHIAVKNNGRIKKGIVIENPTVNISPTIYLEEFYERFRKGESMERILTELTEFYEEVKYDESWDTKRVESYEAVRDKIVFKLIHTEKNQELLKDIPHIEVMDLSIVFYVLLEIRQESTASMLIRNEHLEVWGLEEKSLFSLACENAERLLPARLFMMLEIMEESLDPKMTTPRNLLDIPKGEVCGENGGKWDIMFVLTNSIRSFGAGSLFYPGVMEAAGKIIQEDYYILPSSIHELILVPKSQGLEKKEMEAMVRDANNTVVAAEEQLSDHYYFYDREQKKLMMM